MRRFVPLTSRNGQFPTLGLDLARTDSANDETHHFDGQVAILHATDQRRGRVVERKQRKKKIFLNWL